MALGFGLILLFILAGIGLWLGALIDAIQVEDDSFYKSGTKLIWVLVIIFAGWIGAILYLAIGRPEKGQRKSNRSLRGPGASPMPPLPPPPG